MHYENVAHLNEDVLEGLSVKKHREWSVEKPSNSVQRSSTVKGTHWQQTNESKEGPRASTGFFKRVRK